MNLKQTTGMTMLRDVTGVNNLLLLLLLLLLLDLELHSVQSKLNILSYCFQLHVLA
jgi:hypothetical protein